MRRLVWCGIGLMVAGQAVAGEIYGTVSMEGGPVAQGVRVEVQVSDKVYRTTTNQRGGYRLFVSERGRGVMRVYLANSAPSIAVFSSTASVRYDLLLVREQGVLRLKRN